MGNCCTKEGKDGKTGADAAGSGDRKRILIPGKKFKKPSADEGPSFAYLVKNKEDFNNQLKEAGEEKLIVVDFYASWCGPCKMVKPKIEQMAEKMLSENVIFLKVDVDECEDVASDYDISSMPTFVLIKNFERKDEMTGVNLEKLQELIAKHK